MKTVFEVNFIQVVTKGLAQTSIIKEIVSTLYIIMQLHHESSEAIIQINAV